MTASLALFLVLLTFLALQLRSGHDPALSAAYASRPAIQSSNGSQAPIVTSSSGGGSAATPASATAGGGNGAGAPLTTHASGSGGEGEGDD